MYWVVEGDVPLSVALEIYNEKKYRPYIMVAGLNEKSRPDDLKPATPSNKRSIAEDKYVWAKPKIGSDGTVDYFIPFYGITSLEAISFFVETLKKNQLF